MRGQPRALWVWITVWGLCHGATSWATDAAGSGFAASENFTVMTPRQESADAAERYADQVLDAAEQLRREIATEWLGEPLPDSQGRTIVTVSFEPVRDVGLTWAIDNPKRKYHSLVLITSPQLALSHTLAHEMVHVVLATRFAPPRRLPIWIEEGIAGRYDDETPRQLRQQVLARFVRTQRWPDIAEVFQAKTFQATDQEAYSVATSVTSLLLARDGDKQKFVEFGDYGNTRGWNAALQRFYGITSVSQLQLLWQRTVSADTSANVLAWGSRRLPDRDQ